MSTPFTIDFGAGLTFDPSTPDRGPEVVYQGATGLALCGTASKALATDLDGEHHEPGSLLDTCDMWGLAERPPLYWEHGRDPLLGKRAIGYALHYDAEPGGLSALSFVPREVGDLWHGPGATAARARFDEVYADLRAGRARGYSIGGTYTVRPGSGGKAIRTWHMDDLSAARRPCLPAATFRLLDQDEFDLLLQARRVAAALEQLSPQKETPR